MNVRLSQLRRQTRKPFSSFCRSKMPNFFESEPMQPESPAESRARVMETAREDRGFDEAAQWYARGHHLEQQDDEDEDEEEDEAEDEGEDRRPDLGSDSPEDPSHRLFRDGLRQLEQRGLVDIGNAAHWSVTSYKQGYDVGNLRDDSADTFWQSDGQLPHSVCIRFTKRVAIERISLFLNYMTDESYTPSSILVFAGSGDHDLVQVRQFEMETPIGWRHIKFDTTNKSKLLRCFIVKLVLLANHQNGKDTHLRAIKVMSLSSDSKKSTNDAEIGFTSLKLISESSIR